MEVAVFQQSQQPYPVQGDSLPEPTVAQLKWLLRGERTDRERPLNPKQQQPPCQLAGRQQGKSQLQADRVEAAIKAGVNPASILSAPLNGRTNL